MSRTLLGSLVAELEALLEPLTLAVEDPGWRDRLLFALGIDKAGNAGPLIDVIAQVVQLREQITALAVERSPSFETVAAVLEAADRAFIAIDALQAGGVAPAVRGLAETLIQLLVGTHLANRFPLLHRLGELLTIIQPATDASPTDAVVSGDDILRMPVRISRIRPRRLVDLLQDPVKLLKGEYLNDLATADQAAAAGDRLFPRVANVLTELGVPWTYGLDPGQRALLDQAAPLLEHALTIFLDERAQGAPADIGVMLAFSSADMDDLGLVASPFGALSLTHEAGNWSFVIEFTAAVEGIAYGRHGLTLVASPGTIDVGGRVTATLGAPDPGPAFVFGSPTGTRLELGGAKLAAETALSVARQSLAFSIDLSPAALVIAPGDGDSFLASLLPAEGMRTQFDLGIGWSSDKGVTFKGQAGLDATIPVGRSLAGVTLSSVHVGLQARDGRIAGDVSLTLAASIGPVRAVVDRVGVEAKLTFPDEDSGARGGNVGIANLALGFKTPDGIGLAIDASGVVTGGGFLYHDATLGLYAGAMQLSLHEQLTLKAFGLIATRLPGGARGYSLLVFITAEDFRPVPLGLGFNLLGIGGMVAVHRTFDEDALRRGLKDGSLAALLFPRDPVGNASSLMRGLDSAFPARRGSYLLGLLAKIGWFTPTLVLFDLALILEFGGRKRLLALGSITARLPSADNDLVRLDMEALGVIDFDAGTIAIDAQLVDSRLVHKFPILGSAALRAKFGSGPGFVLAVGGLNPHFTPPAGLPALDRVSIALSSGDNPRLICEAYFAITSNTVQFGARASLYASAAGFSVQGDVGFDVLVQIVPLHFIADFHASVQLKRGSHNLFMVSVDGELEGPRPLRVSGKASFEILWCDFSVHFDTTLVRGEPPPLPPAVDIFAALVAALASPSSWSTQRGSAPPHGVALKSLPPAAAAAPLVLDPLGQIVVKQEVVPLDTGRDIDTFGGAPVAGARRFVLGATLNGTPLTSQRLQSPFAPAQFFVMSDDDKLAAPSFEPMDAGATFGSAATVFDPAQAIAAPLEYRTIVIQKTGAAPAVSPPSGYSLDAAHLAASSTTGAAARSPLRQVGAARFRNPAVTPGATLPARRWTIMPLGDGGPASVAASVRTFSEYDAALKAMNRAGARWQLLPSFEIGG